MKTRCQLHLCCHWPPCVLSHAYNSPALRGDFKVTYLPSQPQKVPNLSSVTLPCIRSQSITQLLQQPISIQSLARNNATKYNKRKQAYGTTLQNLLRWYSEQDSRCCPPLTGHYRLFQLVCCRSYTHCFTSNRLVWSLPVTWQRWRSHHSIHSFFVMFLVLTEAPVSALSKLVSLSFHIVPACSLVSLLYFIWNCEFFK